MRLQPPLVLEKGKRKVLTRDILSRFLCWKEGNGDATRRARKSNKVRAIHLTLAETTVEIEIREKCHSADHRCCLAKHDVGFVRTE